MEKNIKLYYAKLANMGDLLNDLIIRRCFDCNVERCSFLDGDMSAIGSHLAMYTYHGTPLMKLQQFLNGIKQPTVYVWGTGFINYSDTQGKFFKRDMRFLAVRGELTRQNVERMTGKILDIPTGDAGILADKLLDEVPEKLYDVGVIPHICDLKDPAAQALADKYDNSILINVKDDPIEVIRQIAQCRYVLSSSLHGLIVADSFNVPNMHIVFDDRLKGDGYKFDDYYSAYGVEHVQLDLRNSAPPSLEQMGDSYAITEQMVSEKKGLLLDCFPRQLLN
jgi:hypothetical protein